MNLFFSPPVKSYSLLCSHHQACQIVQSLISTGFVQFQLSPYDDSTDPFYIIYSRLKAIKHKLLKMIEVLQNNYNEVIKEPTSKQKLQIVGKMKDYMEEMQIDHLKYLDHQQSQIEIKNKKFTQFSSIYDSLLNKINKNQEELDCIKAKRQVINKDYLSEQFSILTGICSNKDRKIVQRLIFRKSQGHCYFVFKQRNGDPHQNVFLCFINKGAYKHIGQKINSIFSINKVSLYQLPNMEKNLNKYQTDLKNQNQQLNHVLSLAAEQLTNCLREHMIGKDANLRHNLIRITYLERLIYIICHSKKVGYPSSHVMLTIHIPQSQTIPNFPVSSITTITSQKKRTIMPRLPCLFQVNTLTQLYSIPKHNQILPSIFMFSTVPILFGMMFSDFGHGAMFLALSIYLKLGPIFKLMAFMSIYCGIIYNQFFGMKILRWDIGILDPIWGISQNGLNFENSLKMKIAMIVAFFHMSFGLSLKIVNQLKRKQIKTIIYDSIPKIGLLFTTVGYLDYMILTKWLVDFKGNQSTAPSIINSILQLYLGWNQTRTHSIFESIETQKFIGSLMLKISLFFILLMCYNHTIRQKTQNIFYLLFSKKKGYKKIDSSKGYSNFQDDDQIHQISQQLQEAGHKISSQNLSKDQKNFYVDNEEIHSQLGPLEVFQYVLSLISSTTSYLRLFALSLAHSKLSHLLLTFLLSGLSQYDPYLSFFKCLVFFLTTVGMMLLLDVMQCIMHVVRLHWVQWMGKFYQGGGKIFMPEIEQNYI